MVNKGFMRTLEATIAMLMAISALSWSINAVASQTNMERSDKSINMLLDALIFSLFPWLGEHVRKICVRCV